MIGPGIPANLPHRADISRTRSTADQLGGEIFTQVSVATSQPCFLQTASQREKDQYSKRGFVVSHKAYVRESTAVLLSEDCVFHTITSVLTPAATFPAGIRLRVISFADATVNVDPELTKVMLSDESADVNP